jgi:putative tryptophan/tyrosine transport system substrate-binding protein
VTGINAMSSEVMTKRIGLLHELLPRATRFAALMNPNDPNAEPVSKDLDAGAAAVGGQLELFTATNIRDIEVAFANLVQRRPDALLIVPQGLLINRRLQIVTLATRHGLPAIYPSREFAEIGGLMSYGSSPTEQYRQAGIYTGRVLKGEKPAEMPVLRASKFEFVINLLILLSQKVAADGEQNHLFGRIHTSAMGRLVWVCRDQTMMKRGFRPMWRGSRA